MRSLVAPAYPIAGRCSDRSDVPRGTRRPTPGPSPAWSQRLGARRRRSTFPRCERRPAPEIAAVRSSGRHSLRAGTQREHECVGKRSARARGHKPQAGARTPATALPWLATSPSTTCPKAIPPRNPASAPSGRSRRRRREQPPLSMAPGSTGPRRCRAASGVARRGVSSERLTRPVRTTARRPWPDGTAWFRCRERLVRSPCQIDSDRRRRGPGCGTVGRSGLGLAVPAVELDPADGSAPRPAFTAAASAASHRYLGPPWVRPRSLRRMGRISWSIG